MLDFSIDERFLGDVPCYLIQATTIEPTTPVASRAVDFLEMHHMLYHFIRDFNSQYGESSRTGPYV